MEELEKERREMEERFTIKAGEEEKLRGQEVLSKWSRKKPKMLEKIHFVQVSVCTKSEC